MSSDSTLRRQWLIMAIGVAVSLVLPILAWAMVPVGGVSLQQARTALMDAARPYGLQIVALDDAPYRTLPVWIDWHPARLLQQRDAPGAPVSEHGLHYRFRTPAAVEFDCELHSRSGEVLWIRLDGGPEASGIIGPLRTDLRLALPWLPVSSPWK